MTNKPTGMSLAKAKEKRGKTLLSDEDVENFGDQAETETQKSKKIVEQVKKRIKTVRDTYTLPQPEFEQIEKLRLRAMKKGIDRNKSEMIRAGLRALKDMNETDFKAAINKIVRTKRGCK